MKFSCCAISRSSSGHARRRLAVLRFGLLVVALGDGAFLEAHALQPRSFAQTLRGALRDLELAVERAQLDVAARDRRDERQHDRALALLAGEQAGFAPTRSRGAAGPRCPIRSSPKGSRRKSLKTCPPPGTADGRGLARRPGAPPIALALDLRKLCRAHDAVLRGGLSDVGGRDLEILVVRERRPDEVREDRVLELVPPRDVGDLGCFGRRRAARRRAHRFRGAGNRDRPCSRTSAPPSSSASAQLRSARRDSALNRTCRASALVAARRRWRRACRCARRRVLGRRCGVSRAVNGHCRSLIRCSST